MRASSPQRGQDGCGPRRQSQNRAWRPQPWSNLSRASTSACCSVKPFSVKRLTNRWVSNAIASDMPPDYRIVPAPLGGRASSPPIFLLLLGAQASCLLFFVGFQPAENHPLLGGKEETCPAFTWLLEDTLPLYAAKRRGGFPCGDTPGTHPGLRPPLPRGDGRRSGQDARAPSMKKAVTDSCSAAPPPYRRKISFLWRGRNVQSASARRPGSGHGI